jgi:hypothetical protein
MENRNTWAQMFEAARTGGNRGKKQKRGFEFIFAVQSLDFLYEI